MMTKCQGKTKTNDPCGNKPVSGYSFCRHHLPPSGGARMQVLCLSRDIPVISLVEIDVVARALSQVRGWDVSRNAEVHELEGDYSLDRQYGITLSAHGKEQVSRVHTSLKRVMNIANDTLVGVQLVYAIIGWLLDDPVGQGIFDLDKVIGELGLPCRGAEQKIERRKTILAWVNLLTTLRIIGNRRSNYGLQSIYDSLPLIQDEGRFGIGQHNGIPKYIKLRVSDWLLANRDAFSGLGNMRAIYALHGGSVTGRWAKAIALTLLVEWRLRASTISLTDDGGLEPFAITRKALLSRYLPSGELESAMVARNAVRYRGYFSKALELLVARGIIGKIVEPEAVYPEREWQQFWQKGMIMVMPSAADTAVITVKTKRNKKHRDRQQRLLETAKARKAVENEQVRKTG